MRIDAPCLSFPILQSLFHLPWAPRTALGTAWLSGPTPGAASSGLSSRLMGAERDTHGCEKQAEVASLWGDSVLRRRGAAHATLCSPPPPSSTGTTGAQVMPWVNPALPDPGGLEFPQKQGTNRSCSRGTREPRTPPGAFNPLSARSSPEARELPGHGAPAQQEKKKKHRTNQKSPPCASGCRWERGGRSVSTLGWHPDLCAARRGAVPGGDTHLGAESVAAGLLPRQLRVRARGCRAGTAPSQLLCGFWGTREPRGRLGSLFSST